jgi:hypothetical protein
MKGSITVNGKRIDIGAKVLIIDGPFASRLGFFRGRAKSKPGKILVTPALTTTRILLDANSIRKAEARP